MIPASSLLPNVPGTQYPGITKLLFAHPHHSLKTYILRPPCNIPGVANNTIDNGLLIRFLSNG